MSKFNIQLNPENDVATSSINKDSFMTLGHDGKSLYVEVYSGENYVPESTKKSYSRIYRGANGLVLEKLLPKTIVQQYRAMYQYLKYNTSLSLKIANSYEKLPKGMTVKM